MQIELSIEADFDLQEIFEYSYNNFGEQIATQYVSSFDECFNSISLNPNIGRNRDEIRIGLRSLPKGAHIVFYRIIKNSTIRVVRILHSARDVPNFL